MENISTVVDLRNAIRVLEVEQSAREYALKEQFKITYESLKPANIIKRTIRDLFSASNLNENLTGTAVGSAGGYILKKLFIGSSGNPIRKLIGAILQLGLTNIASNRSEDIKSFGLSLIHRILSKLEKKKDQETE